MSGFHGQFVWCELLTTDVAAATTFYEAVIGWNAKDAGMTDRLYTIVGAGETGVGGIMEQPEASRQAGNGPRWLGYVAADDLAASAARLVSLGGTIHRDPEDIPGVGRFAVVGDPHGPVFVLFTPLPTDQPRPIPAPGTPGHVGWHELHTRDREAGFAFYADLFGWTKAQAIDMAPAGIYQIFAIAGRDVGGMINRGEADPVRGWLHYFNVDDINAAVTRVKDAGGQIVNGPMQVPGGSWIAHGVDPQGAIFALVAAPAGSSA